MSELTTTLQKPTGELALRVGAQELKIPEQAKQILLTRTPGGWSYREVATIGQHSAFIRRDEAGIARLMVKTVPLQENLNEIVKVSGTWTITVAGYNKLNQYASVFVSNPPIIVDGREQLNPYHHIVDGVVKQITSRRVAIGYSPSGNLVAIDCIRTFDVDVYFKQDLFSKADKYPQAARFGLSIQCPMLPDAKVEEDRGVIYVRKDSKLYYFKPIKDNEGLWIDPTSSDIRDLYSEYNKRVKFADVITQSIATRNALKAHPAISATKVLPKDGIAEVTVFSWRHELDLKKLHDMTERVTRGERIEGVEMISDAAIITNEEVEEAAESEGDESDSGKPVNVPVETAIQNQQNEQPSGTALFDKKGDSTPEQKPIQPVQQEQSAESVPERIKKIAAEKGIDLTMFCKNMFDSRFENLTPEQCTKLLGVLEKVTAGRKESK